jgi:DNA polymerase-1
MQIPLFEPQSKWRPPAVLPELDTVISIDLETHDPNIKKSGPGYKRRDGKVVGIAIADKHHQIYLPFDHFGGDNLDKQTVLSYADTFIKKADEIIMANATYDLGWLETLSLSVSCPVRDIQVAEALIDEEKFSYSLDSIAKKYLKKGKKEDGLQTAADTYGISAKSDMWKLPARHVGKYAEADARLTYDAYQHQIPILKEQGLWTVWELECELIPVLVYMSRMGVPVDLDAAEQLNNDLKIKESALLNEFKNLDIWSPQQLGKYCESLGLVVPRTEKGNYSVAKDFLLHCEHPQVKKIQEARSINRLRKVFIEDIILNQNHNGRIHADFRQTASDEGGTRSGRLSSSNPNMQQVPKRSDIGKRIRSLYIAEPGRLWCKADYSSQEPRLQVHYALLGQFGKPLPGAEQASLKTIYIFLKNDWLTLRHLQNALPWDFVWDGNVKDGKNTGHLR